MFKLLILFAALAIASVSAFFSVTGLSLLFHGAFLAVVIMAASLEMGKLVTASFITRYWKKLTKPLKIYYSIAVAVLMMITSAGIYGFLSNAYQQTNITVQSVQSKVDLYQNQKASIQSDISRFTTRINTLNQQRTIQQDQYKQLTDTKNWINARRVWMQMQSADSTIAALNQDISERNQKLLQLDSAYEAAKQTSLQTSRSIGGFRFIAENFNVPIGQVVKWFIFIIIFVFDPLAVALIIGYNYVHYGTDYAQTKETKREDLKPVESTPEPTSMILDAQELQKGIDTGVYDSLPLMDRTVHNPATNGSITVREALKLGKEHPAHESAMGLLSEYVIENYDKLRINNA